MEIVIYGVKKAIYGKEIAIYGVKMAIYGVGINILKFQKDILIRNERFNVTKGKKTPGGFPFIMHSFIYTVLISTGCPVMLTISI